MYMVVHNTDIAAVFNEIADLLEIEGENPFRIRAYRNAARTLNGWTTSVQGMVEQGRDLETLPGIGTDLEAKITEIVHTGTCALLEQLRRTFPATITDLLKVPGIGPKRVKALHEHLDIDSLGQLQAAARAGKLSSIPGFGERVEQRVLEAVESRLSKKPRIDIGTATHILEPLLRYLRESEGTARAEAAGSFRRQQETVGDLDILIASMQPEKIAERFVRYDGVDKVLAHGGTRASIVLRHGPQVDLRIVAEECFGAALHYFTGSKAHNIALRALAQERDWKLNEYGLFAGDRRMAGETEESVFEALGLAYIEPELRENRGEIEAAQQNRLPRLVELSDLRGDLHAHTSATDGRNDLRDMALAAKRRGLAYLGITDHTQRLTVARGLDVERLSRQIDEIDRLNEELDGITLLKGIEADIHEDGRLDLPDTMLRRLDYVIGAVHSRFDLPRKKQTDRILKAMDAPFFTMLAHPTGRLLGERDPYDVDMERIIRHAGQRGCMLELNAQPSRLDLDDIHCRMAKEEGVLVSVNSDAHSTQDFDNLRFGIGQARRGWLERSDVLNTRPLRKLKRILTAARAI